MRLKFFQGSVTLLKKMANYPEERVKLTNTQLNKLKSAGKNKTGTILRLNKKNFKRKTLRWRIAAWIISNKKTNN